jgi:ATP-dependent RNA helicase DOB1
MNPGRLLKVTEILDDGTERSFGWGLLLNFHRISKQHLKTLKKHDQEDVGLYLADVLLPCMPSGLIAHDEPQPYDPKSGVKCEMQVVPVSLKHIEAISALKLAEYPKDLKKKKSRGKVWKTLQKLRKQFPTDDDIPLLDPIEDMNITSKEFKKTYKQWKKKRKEQKAFVSEHPTCDLQYDLFLERHRQGVQVRTLRNKLGDLQRNRQLTKKLRGMKQVLRRLGYVSEMGVLTLKGRVACEISNGNELVTTELLFNGVFRDLKPAQIGALFSCFAFQEKSSENQKLPDVLLEPYKILVDNIKQVIDVENDADLQIDATAYLERFQPHLMNITYQWCNGAKFMEICKMTNILEGSIVRAMRRLEEMLGEMEKASSVMGNDALKAKFQEARKLMRRDIVFAASLYLI